MKVAFVHGAFENLGIEYLSAILKKNGHETFLAFDPQLFNDLFVAVPRIARLFDYRQTVVEQLRRERPDIVAMGVVSDLYGWASDMARRIKAALGDIPIVMGGPHATAVPDRVLLNPFIDYVVVSEGEYALAELVEALQNGTSVEGIANVGFKRGGSIVINPPRPLNQDLDELPFADKDLFLKQNPYAHREYNIVTSRGCVYACTFCHNSVERRLLWQRIGQYERRRSVDNVLQELAEAKRKYNFDTVCFWDEVFTYDVEWLQEFSARYRDEIGIPFWTFIHPRHVSERVVKLLEDAGCWEVEIGVQTLNPEIQKEVGRIESRKMVAQAIDLFRASKIRVVLDVIFGLPGLKESDYVDLVQFFTEHTPTKIQTFWLRYYPKTDIVETGLARKELTPAEVEEINEGRPARAAVSGGTRINGAFEKYQTALTLLPVLPKGMALKLVERNWLRFLPRISLFAHVVTRLFDVKNQNDAGGRRFKGRMLYFTKKKLLQFLPAPRALPAPPAASGRSGEGGDRLAKALDGSGLDTLC